MVSHLINIKENKGTNQGFCNLCFYHFKKGDYIILIEKGEINKIKYIKICEKCYIQQLANKIGWKKLHKLVLEMVSNEI